MSALSNMNANSNQTANQLLYSRRDAARLLGGISDRTIDNYIRSGHLKPTRIVNRVFIHQDELTRIAKQGAGQ
jgi:predicted site-specific integrase-resolvase